MDRQSIIDRAVSPATHGRFCEVHAGLRALLRASGPLSPRPARTDGWITDA
jgi:hypothetical protein